MNRLDIPTLKVRLDELADMLPGGKRLSDTGVTGWGQTLRDFAIQDIVSALDSWARRETKFPAPAMILKALTDTRGRQMEERERQAKQNAPTLAHAVRSNPDMARRMASLTACMKNPIRSGPKDWAKRVYDAYVTGEPWTATRWEWSRTGGLSSREFSHTVNPVQLRMACDALGRNVADATTAKTLRETMP